MSQEDNQNEHEEGIVTPDSMPETPEALSDPATEARTLADHVFQARSHDGEDLRMGQVLRRVREILNIEMDDVNKATGISKNYLMSIERMETKTIPSGYLVPYLIKYAKELGLPHEAVAADYTRECGAVEEIENTGPVPKIGSIKPQRSNAALIAVAGLAAVMAIGGTIFVLRGGDDGPDIEAKTGIVSVNGARESLFSDVTPVIKPALDLPLELHAVRQGWLEVRGADGTIFRSRVLAEGESYFPRLGGGWTVSARDGGAFEWRVGNVVIAPLGPDDTAIFSVSVDDNLALAAEKTAPAVAETGARQTNP